MPERDGDLGEVKGDLREIKSDLGEVKTDLREMKGDLAEVKSDLREVKTDIREMKGDLGNVKTDLRELRGEVRELKATVVTGFSNMPTRQMAEEMIRILRGSHRMQDERSALHTERLAELDLRIRTQHVELQQSLQALSGENRLLSTEVRTLVTRIDAIIRGRRNGEPPV